MINNEVAPVLKRLQYFLSEKTVNERINNIRTLMYDWPKPFLAGKFMGNYKDFLVSNNNKEQVQDELIALMINHSREKFPNNYNLEKETKQIKAIHAILEGRHVHMGTGEGKTSVVIPIVAVVKALTSHDQMAVIASSDEVNLIDLQRNVQNFIQSIKSQVPDLPDINFLSKEQLSPEADIEALDKKMLVEAITTGKYDEETNNGLKRAYWERQLKPQKEDDFLSRIKSTDGPKIVLATDRDLVFSYSEKPEQFLNIMSDIYMDEADIPYNRKSPYFIGQNEFLYLPETFNESTKRWLLNYLLYRRINQDKDYTKDKGESCLTGAAMKRLDKIEFHEVFSQYKHGVKINNKTNPIVKDFKDAIEIITKKLKLDEQQQLLLEVNLVKTLQDKTWQSKKNLSSMYGYIGQRLAKFHDKKGLDYIHGTEAKSTQIRDYYIDQILESHEYNPEEKMAVLAIEGEFEFVPINKRTNSNLRFETFVKNIGRRLHCLSGTLLYPDPLTKKVETSRFANFLKEATGSKIEKISQPNIKDVPTPEITKTDEEAINTLVDGINGNSPSLVISYKIEDSLKIFHSLQKKFGEDKVVHLPSKPSDTTKALEYDKESRKYFQQLADGEITAIVSSGAAGFAVNIVKSDGSFPDLHVAIHNLPANRLQLMQILGRRRANGSNYSWTVSEETIKRDLYSIFEKKESLYGIKISKHLDPLVVDDRLKKAKTDPKEGKKLMLELLRQKEIFNYSDDQFNILFDEMIGIIDKSIGHYIKEKIVHDPDNKIFNFQSNNEKDKAVAFLTMCGIPDVYFFLYELSQTSITHHAGDQRTEINKIGSQFLSEIDYKNSEPSKLKIVVDDWYEERKKSLLRSRELLYEETEIIRHIPSRRMPLIFNPTGEADRNGNIWGMVSTGAHSSVYAYKDQKENVFELFMVANNQPFPPMYQHSLMQNSITSFDKRQTVILKRLRYKAK